MLNEIRKSQLSYGFTYLWNIRNSMEDIRRRKGKMKGEKSEWEMIHEILWTTGNKMSILEGKGVEGVG